jgi:hypothetical protein
METRNITIPSSSGWPASAAIIRVNPFSGATPSGSAARQMTLVHMRNAASAENVGADLGVNGSWYDFTGFAAGGQRSIAQLMDFIDKRCNGF